MLSRRRRKVERVVNLHENLLLAQNGRFVNRIGAICVIVVWLPCASLQDGTDKQTSFAFERPRIVQYECDQEERGSEHAESLKVKYHCRSSSSTQDKRDPDSREQAYLGIWSY